MRSIALDLGAGQADLASPFSRVAAMVGDPSGMGATDASVPMIMRGGQIEGDDQGSAGRRGLGFAGAVAQRDDGQRGRETQRLRPHQDRTG